MDLIVFIHRADEGGFWTEVPALDGCFAQGETLDEVLEDARGAVQTHLDALQQDGVTPPDSQILIATIHADSPSAA